MEKHKRKYSYAAKMVASFVIAAKFVASRHTTTTATATGDTPVAQLAALHMQCRQQARQQDQFDVVGKTEFLDWEAVQRVRVSAEKALGSVKTKASKLKLTRDVTVLRLLADQPPDRVGVVRTLRLGGSLKRKPDGSYELDLSEPGAHKTSAVFGATRTSINASISPWLDRYVAAAEIPADGFLFHARGDKRVAIAPSAWSLGASASKRRSRATATSRSARRTLGRASLPFCAAVTTMTRQSKPQPSQCGIRPRSRLPPPTTRADPIGASVPR